MKSILIVTLLGMIAFYGINAQSGCTAANAATLCTGQVSGKTLKCCKSGTAPLTCATTEAECNTPASVLTLFDAVPSTPCDASKCIFGCCRTSDGKCGKAAECAAIQGPCNSTACSSGCCDSNKVCLTVDLDKTANCKYCTGGSGDNNFYVCPGVSTTGALRTGQCESSQCQYACCQGNVCGTKEQCCGANKECAGYDFGTATCDGAKCQYGCCAANNKCGTQDQCCGVGKFCAGYDFGTTTTCDATKCQYGCCQGTKCGTQTECATTSSKSWIWWVVGGAAALLLLLIVVVIIIRRRRQRLLAGYQSSSNPYQQGY